MAGYVVVLDPNVLCGIEVTDFFATMATRRLFRQNSSWQSVGTDGLTTGRDVHACTPARAW